MLNAPWLLSGLQGVIEVGLLAVLVGLTLSVFAHWLAPRLHWRQGSAIGIALIVALALAAGGDAWNLLYCSIVRMESPFVIQRTLGAIRDPAWLGTRVVAEFFGATLGVMLGWYLALLLRHR